MSKEDNQNRGIVGHRPINEGANVNPPAPSNIRPAVPPPAPPKAPSK